MDCERCTPAAAGGTGDRWRAWCAECEHAYDGWVRQHATDVVWAALGGTLIVSAVALGLPLLGLGWVIATGGVFAGAGTMGALHRVNRRRRRRQFLASGLPRAYLADRG